VTRFNLATSSKDGFERSGIFLFNPYLIHVTVKPIWEHLLEKAVKDPFTPQKREMSEATREMNVPEATIASLIEIADQNSREFFVVIDFPAH
jgi:hypothetical protein